MNFVLINKSALAKQQKVRADNILAQNLIQFTSLAAEMIKEASNKKLIVPLLCLVLPFLPFSSLSLGAGARHRRGERVSVGASEQLRITVLTQIPD